MQKYVCRYRNTKRPATADSVREFDRFVPTALVFQIADFIWIGVRVCVSVWYLSLSSIIFNSVFFMYSTRIVRPLNVFALFHSLFLSLALTFSFVELLLLFFFVYFK